MVIFPQFPRAGKVGRFGGLERENLGVEENLENNGGGEVERESCVFFFVLED